MSEGVFFVACQFVCKISDTTGENIQMAKYFPGYDTHFNILLSI